MKFAILNYLHVILPILTVVLNEFANYLKTKKFRLLVLVAFVATLLFVGLLFTYLGNELYENLIVLKVLLVLNVAVVLLILLFYFYNFDKGNLEISKVNIMLLLSIVFFSQVSNLSNTMTLISYSRDVIVIDQEKIHKGNDVFFGPYISLPNGFFEFIVNYSASEDTGYRITTHSDNITLKRGILSSSYSSETNRVLFENNLAKDVEIIIPTSEHKLKVHNYVIVPIFITEYFLLSSLQVILSSVIVFLFMHSLLSLVSILLSSFGVVTKRLLLMFIPSFLTLSSVFVLLSIFGIAGKTELLYTVIAIFFGIINAWLLLLFRVKANIPNLLIILVVVFSAVILSSINFGLPQINIYPDEGEHTVSSYYFFEFPNVFHDNTWPYFAPHHYFVIHLNYLFIYPVSIIASSLFPEYGIAYFSKNPETLLVLLRLVSLLFGNLSIIMVFLVSREIFKNENIAMISSMILSISPMFFHMSHVAKTNTIIIFGILASIYFAIKYGNDNRKIHLVFSAIFAAFAAAIKVNFATVLVVLGIIYLVTETRKMNFAVYYHLRNLIMVLITFVISFVVFLPNILVVPAYIIKTFFSEARIAAVELPARLASGLDNYIFQGIIIGSGVVPFVLFVLGAFVMLSSKQVDSVVKVYLLSVLTFGLTNLVPLVLSSREIPRYSDFFIPLVSIFSSYILHELVKRSKLYWFLVLLPLCLILLEKYWFMKPITTIEARNWIIENIPNKVIYSTNPISHYHQITLTNVKTDIPTNLLPGDFVVFYRYRYDEKLNLPQSLELVTNFDAWYSKDEYVYTDSQEWMIRFYTNFHKIRALNPTIEIYRVK